jgi:putative two-component system response regulator
MRLSFHTAAIEKQFMTTDRKTIFLVDDDPTNLATGANALDEYYDVLTLNSGARLLNALGKNIPDLILLDVDMPEMNGYEAIKQIKNKPETANVPVIFLTAKSADESELQGLSLGACDYITKPFSPALLRKRIELHLLVESQKRELVNFNNNLQEMVEAKTKTVVELQNAVMKTMAELVEYRDNITGGHIERTQRYFEIMLDALIEQKIYEKEVSTWNIKLVLMSAQLHDVGKIAIEDSILKKPGKLTDEEFEKIKEHPLFGKKIIEKIKADTTEQAFLDYAEVIAVSHHEKWDGSGYPYGLREENIPLLGRVMAIADVYDALVSDRPYKKAFTHEEAVKIITDGKGKHFDPILTSLFLDASDKFKEIAAAYNAREAANRA